MNLIQHRKAIPALIAGLVSTMVAASASAAITHNVSVGPGGSFTFSPDSLTIEVGDTVSWLWASSNHNVISGLPGSPTPYFFSGSPDVIGNTYSVLFDQPFLDANTVIDNIYDYYCFPHAAFGMVGSIQVIPTPGAAAVGLLGLAILGARRRR